MNIIKKILKNFKQGKKFIVVNEYNDLVIGSFSSLEDAEDCITEAEYRDMQYGIFENSYIIKINYICNL